MNVLDFANNAVILNVGIFVTLGVFVWFVGTRISYYADLLSDRLKLGKAFVGLFFLAIATSTPEIGTTVTASHAGNAELALNNIFGGIVFQTAILAIADLIFVRGALTFFAPRPVLLLQGVLLIILLAIGLVALAIGGIGSIAGIGLSSIVLLGAYILSLFLSQQYEGREQWHADYDITEDERADATNFKAQETPQQRYKDWSSRRLGVFFALGTLAIFAAGVLLANLGDALAEQTGLGAGFVGAVLLAIVTSLPELSTTFTAIRIGSYSLAFSNIFGSNCLLLMLVFVADVFYRDGPVMAQATPGLIVSAALGILVTGIYLAGFIERRNRTVLRMGIDSVLVFVVFIVSIFLSIGLGGA